MPTPTTSPGPATEPPRMLRLTPRRLIAVLLVTAIAGFIAGWLARPVQVASRPPDLLEAYERINAQTEKLLIQAEQSKCQLDPATMAALQQALTKNPAPSSPPLPKPAPSSAKDK